MEFFSFFAQREHSVPTKARGKILYASDSSVVCAYEALTRTQAHAFAHMSTCTQKVIYSLFRGKMGLCPFNFGEANFKF